MQAGGLFGAKTAPFGTTATTGGLFGQTTATNTGIFGKPATSSAFNFGASTGSTFGKLDINFLFATLGRFSVRTRLEFKVSLHLKLQLRNGFV